MASSCALAVAILATAAVDSTLSLQFEKPAASGKSNHSNVSQLISTYIGMKQLPGDPDVHEDWDYEPFNDPDVVSKYTDAESVSETLFVIACKAKHKNDVDGMARDQAKIEEFTEKEFQAYVKKLQDANMAQMKETCGHVNTKASKECHEHCTANWAAGGSFSLPMAKQKCLDMCNTKHSNWEAECKDRMDELKNVYIAEQGNLANTKKCQEIHCKDFPQTMMMKDDEAKDAKKEGCEEQCTEKQIKAKCVKRWDLQMDTARLAFEDQCRTETKDGTLKPCQDEGLGKADEDKGKCMDDGKKKCDDDEKKCQDDAKAAGEDSMMGANADSICGVRKDVCNNQVSGKCAKGHKSDLKDVEKKCLKEHKEALEKCVDEKMEGKEDDFKKKCKDDITPTCKEDCDKRCNIPDMRKCQKDMIAKAFGVTQDYCTKLWRWIFDSEQFDKKTMDPVPKAVGGGRFKLIKRNNEDKNEEK